MFCRGTLQLFFVISLFLVFHHLCKGEGCKTMAFVKEDKGGYLQNHTLETFTSDTHVMCRIHCYLTKECLSFNYHQGTGTCEINDSDHLQHPGDLIRRDGYAYQSTKNACQTKPCPVNTTCKANFINGGYRCLCPFDYVEPPRINCEFPYQKVGCFNDVFRKNALSELILTYKYHDHVNYEPPCHGEDEKEMMFIESMRCFISRCAAKAKEKGYQVFGVQNEWECWSGPDGENSYSKYGEADQTRCSQLGKSTKGCDKNNAQFCYGGKSVNYVYRLL